MRAYLFISAVIIAGCGAPEKKMMAQSCLKDAQAPVQLAGANANIGSDIAYREERPQRVVAVEAFDIDVTEVTNAQFSAFVHATAYVTSAEKLQPGFDTPGAAVFKAPSAASPGWWQFTEGANWRMPEGVGSSIKGREYYPVVQISHADAVAYAAWAGRRLPTEAEWEYAAKAGSNALYVWGEEKSPNGTEKANTWQGAFPVQNSAVDGYSGAAPVGCFDPNDFGLYDMIGNVWEWTDSIYQSSEGEPVYTIKGGSYLCAANYCRRYRASARQPQEAGLPTNHIGFRTVSK